MTSLRINETGASKVCLSSPSGIGILPHITLILLFQIVLVLNEMVLVLVTLKPIRVRVRVRVPS
jgi:hypothetical protein